MKKLLFAIVLMLLMSCNKEDIITDTAYLRYQNSSFVYFVTDNYGELRFINDRELQIGPYEIEFTLKPCQNLITANRIDGISD